ncbi:UV excision repair protein RAD23 homolog B-like isoform X2 [Dreissena polymorpha]|uniref:UV excision repair protein RAD23 homolog B-like isoform X2 n=1 Tax=Dreissena polymorpha TaxID=45954 RepID=UPI002263E806|nr:UV excision repair protein RAD23 homolog B-like isoform X2 [Dreissena polymorpha]
MIVTLKTLQQQTFKVEVDPEQTVKELKQKVEKEKGADAFPAAGQKLIYAGKILDDEKPVGFYKIEEKNFVVVMVTKPKPAADSTVIASVPTPAAPTRAAPAPSPQPAPPSAVEPTKTESVSEPPSNTSSSTDASSDPSVSESNLTQASDTTASGSDISTASAESALVTGQMYEDAVANIVAMGFARSEVQRAMRASFNNPDRAVEYLFNGIPELPREEPPPAPTGDAPTPPRPAAPVAAPAAGTGARTGAPPASGEETLAFLRNQPQFQHMRNLLQQNPSLLPELLQQIGRSNPTLLQLISQNQEQFISMLNEQGGESVAGGQGRTPGEGVIHVTQEEKEAIDRLKALGFPEGLCIQAYFACEKNEELAANYLLSHGFDDDDS